MQLEEINRRHTNIPHTRIHTNGQVNTHIYTRTHTRTYTHAHVLPVSRVPLVYIFNTRQDDDDGVHGLSLSGYSETRFSRIL